MMNLLTVVGNLASTRYHEALLLADDVLVAASSFASTTTKKKTNKKPLILRIVPLIEQSFTQFVQDYEAHENTKHPLNEPLILHSIDGYIGGVDNLVQWASKYNFRDIRTRLTRLQKIDIEKELQLAAKEALRNYILTSNNTFAYFDINVPSQYSNVLKQVGRSGQSAAENLTTSFRIIIELFSQQVPKTCANFLSLCEGFNSAQINRELETSTDTNRLPLPKSRVVPSNISYAHSSFHRISPSFIQGGDVVSNTGNDGESIYGTWFEDENFSLPHNARGILACANYGRHANSSQFFISFQPLPTFNQKFVAFGRVIYGDQWLNLMESIGKYNSWLPPYSADDCNDTYLTREQLCSNEFPKFPITIEKSGKFTPELAREQRLEDNFSVSSFSSFSADRLSTTPNSSDGIRSDVVDVATTRKATIVVIGIGSVGKSSLVNHWIGEPSSSTLNTVGLEIHRTAVDGNMMLTFFGLGGNDNLRGYWNNYYESAHAIAVVVPANWKTYENDSYWNTLQYELDDEILPHPYVQGKPILIVCNSFAGNDSSSPKVSSKDIANRLQLEQHPNVQFIECCVNTADGDSNAAAMEGLNSLIQNISSNWENLNGRVRRDIEVSKDLRKEQMCKLKERLMKSEETKEPESQNETNVR